MITERQKRILDAVIREYVSRAEPVASADLVKKYRLPFSPATVRNELMALEEAGFLFQPHTSSGRVPTDRGYRHFINNAVAHESIPDEEEEAFEGIRSIDDPAEFMKRASRLLAHMTRNFVFAGFLDESLFYKSGFGEVVQEPEFSNISMVHEFSELMDHIEDEILGRFDPGELEEPLAFIGAENPIPEARRCGMIISSCATPFQKESVIAMIGPKRMDYERNLTILKYFRDLASA